MDFWKTLIEKFPRLTVYALVLYAIVYSALYGYETYRKNVYEAEKPYIQGVYDKCLEASELVAQIGTSNDYPDADIRKFWILYYGKLVIFENDAVAAGMGQFGDRLRELGPGGFGTGQADQGLLKAALTIAGSCRDLIKDTWHLSITPWQSLDVSVKPICNSPKCG
jgi:hypothetical protein